MKIIYFLIFSILFSYGCLSVNPNNCNVMLDGEVHDECLTFAVVQEYLKTNDITLGLKCKNEMNLTKTSPVICYTSLAIAAAYQNNNFHAVSFCEETFNIDSPDKYGNMIDCLTEVAIIVGDPLICEHASYRYEESTSFWSKILAPPDRSNINLEICKKRAELSRKRIERINEGFFN